MMLDVEIDATGPRRLLDDMIGRLDNPRPALVMLGRSLEEYERDVFGSAGRGTWQPLDADTLEQKAGGSILQDTGLLFRELTSARIVGSDAVQVDAGRAFYGRFLRDGDRGMPRRNPAPKPTTAHVERWADQLVGWIVTGRSR